MKRHDPLTTIHDVARLYDIRDILSLNSRMKLIVCPLPQHVHHHRTPSFSIFTTSGGKQRWKCFGNCALEGDSVDLVGYLFVPGYNPKDPQSIKAAIMRLTSTVDIHPPKIEVVRVPANGLHKTFLPAGNEVLEYRTGRFLTSETLERFQVGQTARDGKIWMSMPAVHGSQLRGIKLRNIRSTDKKGRFSSIPGGLDGLFNYNSVNATQESVAIVKGEIAVMTLAQAGILACAPTGGEGSYRNHEEFLRPLAFARKRIVIGDHDKDPGVRKKMVAAAERRKEIFRAAALYFPPDPFVGIDDWVNAQPDIAIPTIKSWME